MSVRRKSKLKTVILRQQTNINLRTKLLVNSNCMMFLFVNLFVFKGSSDIIAAHGACFAWAIGVINRSFGTWGLPYLMTGMQDFLKKKRGTEIGDCNCVQD